MNILTLISLGKILYHNRKIQYIIVIFLKERRSDGRKGTKRKNMLEYVYSKLIIISYWYPKIFQVKFYIIPEMISHRLSEVKF